MSRSESLANLQLAESFTSARPDSERERVARVLAAPARRPHAAKVDALIARRSLVSRVLSVFAK